MALVEVKVPDIGDFKDVQIIEVLVKPGDTIRAEQSLITVESDKASMEIPAPLGGVVRELKVKVGDKVNQGSLVLVVEADGAAAAPAAGAAPVEAAAPATATTAPAAPAAAVAPAAEAAPPLASQPVAHSHPSASLPSEPEAPSGRLPHASPSVRAFARQLGVPLGEVGGSGSKGRITHEDVQAFVKAVMAGQTHTAAQGAGAAATGGGGFPALLPWPQVDFTRYGTVERVELSRIKKVAGANLHRNWVMIPHVTNCDDADITELEAFRLQLNREYEKDGVKITMLAFLVKAAVAALKKFPTFNASLDGDHLILKHYFHIGVAVDTPNGLVVPVIKDADKKGLVDVAREMAQAAGRAREGKLSPLDMVGGCFSISSLGSIGGTYFTPIINAPEVAILGVCQSVMRSVWNGSEFQPRLILPLSLSWDHRVVDGAAAARFNSYVVQVLADFRRVLL